MGFPRRLLLEGESIALDLRPNWTYFVGSALTGALVLAGLVGSRFLEGDIRPLGFYAAGGLALVWAGFVAVRLAGWATTHFVVTSDRIIFRTGVLAKHGRDIPLERVNDITSNQSFLERLTGSGDLLIESAGERGQQRFTDVSRPDRVQQEIYRQMEANAARAAGARPAQEVPAPPSVTDQIAALADLRDRGAISAAEFEAKKAELLSRM